MRGQALVDSLLSELPRQRDDTGKVNFLRRISFQYREINPDEALKYAQQARTLAARLGWQNGVANACQSLGQIYLVTGDFAKSLEYDLLALKIDEELGDKRGIAALTCNIGLVYQYQSNYPKALDYLFKALKMDEETGNKEYIANVSGNIGIIYCSMHDYPKALEYSTKQLQMAEELGDKQGASNATGSIGNVYLAMGAGQKALDYFLRSLKISEELGDKQNIAGTSNNIGSAYDNLRDYAEAVTWQFKAIKLAREIGDKNTEALALGGTAADYLNILTDTARPANPAGSELQRKPYQYDSLIPKGRDALLQRAVDYLGQAIAICREIGDLDDLQTNYAKLATADSLLGDFRGAYFAHIRFAVLKDSVFSKEKAVEIAKLEMQKNMDAAEIKYLHQRSYTYLGIACAIALMGFLFFIVRNNKLLAKEKQVSEAERKKSDSLLLNILPAEVATELKTHGRSITRQYDNVTVIFTDFVNFTLAGEQMKPGELIEELHTCFKEFDEITGKYNIEKIKTIGDAYLAVAGLPVADANHAENAIRAAGEICAFMAERVARLGNKTFEVRIGAHSGTVLAGIVGVKKFAYDIWGDTVNTAARMEQNSMPGKINISQATYDLVKDQFNCVYRGEIEAKNKGMMKMYFVSQES